jgi:catechol-2,3-dioxygenase
LFGAIQTSILSVQVYYECAGAVLMAQTVELKVQDPAQAAKYYESLLGLNPCGSANGTVSLAAEDIQLRLSKTSGKATADTTLIVSAGMLARILDVAMKVDCQISVKSAEQVQMIDSFGQHWTLQRSSA